MNEKILSNKKNGMGMLLLFCLLYLIAIAGCVLSAIALEHEFDAPPDVKAKDLAQRFIKNFAKYEGNEAGKALVAAGPQL